MLTDCAEKLRDRGASVRLGAIPLPVKLMLCEPLLSFPVTVKIAVRDPTPLGVNRMVRLHFPFGSSKELQGVSEFLREPNSDDTPPEVSSKSPALAPATSILSSTIDASLPALLTVRVLDFPGSPESP